ncbi:hypothetical protein ZIOFF_038654 [Zingiber officinale]|uniref:Uncharacterized protein n=1 Tax=Zingiber officinale TaxID=94328 RepID=A0A8J5G0X3_ZINOF|nr:hypothetical protein ZIOFF_038654 [Zingiber officinale]
MELVAKGWSALQELDRVIDYADRNDTRLIPQLRGAKENFELALEIDNTNTHARYWLARMHFMYHVPGACKAMGHNLALEIQATMPSIFKHPAHVPMWRGAKVAYLLIAMCLFPIAIGGFWAYGNLVTLKQVETRTLEELEELLEFSSQNRTSLTRIMLDNMVVPLPNGDVDVSMLKDAVQLVNGRFETEFFLFLSLEIISATTLVVLGQSSSGDSMTPNNSLIDGQTLISAGGIFQLGFFSPDQDSENGYLGIWYYNRPPGQSIVLMNVSLFKHFN